MSYQLQKTILEKTLVSTAIFAWLMAPIGAGAVVTLPSGSVNFDTLKQTTLTLVDVAVQKLNNAESKIAASKYVSEGTKTALSSQLNTIESNLTAYKTKVEQTTSLEELKAVNQEIVQYLKTNKDAIKQTYKALAAEIATNASAKAQELIAKVEQMLKVLEVTCPSEKASIDALEQQITQLEADIAALKVTIQSKDTAAIKSQTQKIVVLMKSMVENAKKIQAACMSTVPATP